MSEGSRLTVKRMFKQAVVSSLAKRGLELKRSDYPPRGFENFLALYRRFGPAPTVVYDIGVGHGTPWLYESFPDSHFVLVEPQRSFESDVKAILERYKGECHWCTLAEEPGEAVIHVPRNGETGGSLLKRDKDWAAYRRQRGEVKIDDCVVPVSTLDGIASANSRHVIKIDVEGSEIKVLRGGRECVRSADMIILECSVVPRHAGECDFFDIGRYLKEEGFVLADIVEMSGYGEHYMLAYLDAVFVHKDNPFLKAV